MRAKTNISVKEQRQLVLSDFRGVDMSSSPMNVAKNRASSMKNLINEFGVNKKRNGWKEILDFYKEGENEDAKINGIIPFVKEDKTYLLIYSDTQFYRAWDGGGNWFSESVGTLKDLVSDRIQYWQYRNKIYIIGCGDYLVYDIDGNSISSLTSDEPTNVTVPTTTINIAPDGATETLRASYDSPNMLTPWRRNETEAVTDAQLTKTETEDGSSTTSQLAELTYTLDCYTDCTTISVTNVRAKTSLKTKEELTEEELKEKTYFSVTTETEKNDTNKVTIHNPEVGDVYTITFKAADWGDNVKKIKGCKFGILFGVGGNPDRLFLSGNPQYPNVDWHTELEDYTYFPSDSEQRLGTDATSITGYLRMSDTTFATFKETASFEASIYYRTGQWNEYTIDDGGPVKVAEFPVTAGASGESAINAYANATLVSDNLFLSRNGVFGIELSDNAYTSARYAKERSRSVDDSIEGLRYKRDKLKDAVAIVYDGRYYLSVDGVCYIADSRYKYVSVDSTDGSFDYEWWYWTNIPARVFAVYERELMFGTPDGRVCIFDDEFSDRSHRLLASTEITLSGGSTDEFTFEAGIAVSNGDFISFKNDVFGKVAEFKKTRNDGEHDIFTTKNVIYAGASFYLDQSNDEYSDKEYRVLICGENNDTTEFRLICGTEYYRCDDEETHTLYENLKGEQLTVQLIEDNSYERFSLKRSATSQEAISFVLPAIDASSPAAYSYCDLIHKQNVVSEWYSPMLDMGTNEASKTLLKMTVAPESFVKGDVKIGYRTLSAENAISARGTNVFSFGDINFQDFTFSVGFASSYSTRTNVRNFNFIVFRFVSDSDMACAVNTFTATYKINAKNKGVR